MRKTVLPFLLALPLLGQAQSKPGTYVLVDDRTVHYKGELEIFDRGLTSKEGKEKKKVWQASEVYWARVGTRRYLPVGGFTVPAGLRRINVEHGLAQLLDSGRVSLLRYQYTIGGGNANGFMDGVVYLVQPMSEDNAVVIPMNQLTGGNSAFLETLKPYCSARLDLMQNLEKGEVTRRTLPAFFHALNSGQPFLPTTSDKEDKE